MKSRELNNKLETFTQILEFNKKNRNIRPKVCVKISWKSWPKSWNNLQRIW